MLHDLPSLHSFCTAPNPIVALRTCTYLVEFGRARSLPRPRETFLDFESPCTTQAAAAAAAAGQRFLATPVRTSSLAHKMNQSDELNVMFRVLYFNLNCQSPENEFPIVDQGKSFGINSEKRQTFFVLE